MAIARIVIGDESGDGHEKTEEYLFEVPDRFSRAVLMENYEKVKAELGFGIQDFAVEYEDDLLPAPYLQSLKSAGFDSGQLAGFEGADGVSLYSNDMFLIAIFMISKGLEGFEYRLVEPDFDILGWTNMGYGLFY